MYDLNYKSLNRLLILLQVEAVCLKFIFKKVAPGQSNLTATRKKKHKNPTHNHSV